MEALGLIGLVLLLLAFRQNVILILLTATAYVHLVWGDGRISYLVDDMWGSLNNEVLLAIPMFIAAGNVMTRGSIAERLIEVMRVLTQWLPGGLAVATILSCAVFAAISGSSPVTLLAVGTILYPALLREGYSRSFSLGALTSGGTLGIIIPPSIPLILYGIVTEKSISDLFTAGIVPGILLTAVLGVYALWMNRHLPSKPWEFHAIAVALRRGIWALLLPVVLLGGIYTGYFSATEAAAVALGYALFIEIFVHREMRVRDFFNTSVETAKLLGTLFPIVAVALSIKSLLTVEQVPHALAEWIGTIVSDPVTFLLAMNVLLLLVGCFIDVISAILILGPLMLGIAGTYGIDPIHLGIIMVINLEVGFLTPPVGLNLIVATTAFRESFLLVCRAVLPFIALILAVLMVVTFVPELSLFLIR
ncbi:MAG: TRAP transporter large permease [Rhodospirillaceae bacterium]|nr:TRAP transporter large permease [Rhodospirillaceae bacterium]MDE0617476.1 TRAP transporter large permease [Rhodospirillaceae bacterium]MXY40431.1 TRAP transporter large permease [Rhodospirillaceae bacterium]MYH36541.1 TRAP transporter large permease [Rhodospirillaceae bacterium]MYJ73350.1 TRAP transporter large permease [Rhodospirillaceae bacterium]